METTTTTPETKTARAACADALPPFDEPAAWSVAQNAGVQTAIGKLYDDGDLPADQTPTTWAVMNISYEVMLEAKSARAKAALRPFIKSSQPKVPASTQPVGASPVALDYLAKHVAILKAGMGTDKWRPTAGVVALCSGQDFPLVLGTVDWHILIAPRFRGD